MKYLGKIIILSFAMLLGGYTQALPYLSMPSVSSNDTLTPEQVEQKAIALTEKVKQENRLVDLISPDVATHLPVGIVKEVGGMQFIVVLDELHYDRSGAKANAYLTFQFPGNNKNITFKAIDVAFVPWGFMSARMQLVSNKTFSIGNLNFNLSPEHTWVEFDCQGYKRTSLSGEIEFPDHLIVKENPQTRERMDGEKVKSVISAVFTDFSDLLLNLEIEPFQFKGLDGFGFYAQSAVIDMSDITNPVFGNYTSQYINQMLPGIDATLWRGVYIKTFEVKLPVGFQRDASQSTSIGAEDLLIDDMGVTGKLFAENLLSLEQGSVGGWKFSINRFSFALTANTFDSFEFKGKIVLPVSDNSGAIDYTAMVDDNSNFLFSVSPPNSVDFSIWAATATINDNSTITLARENDDYFAQAKLNGSLSISTPSDNSVNIANVDFQGLTIQTEAPNFDIEAFSAEVGDMGGFPIQLTQLGYKKANQKRGINAEVMVSLVKANDNGFSASGEFTIYGEQEENPGITAWRYSNTEFNSFSIDIDKGAFSFYGYLEVFRKDPVYGNGIKGMLDATFQPGIGVSACVQFGSVDGYRYWYADALARLPGIVISPGISLYGFGGGAYYHMSQESASNVELPEQEVSNSDYSDQSGVSLSGVNYIPDKNTHLGLKASVLIGAQGNIKAFNALATFSLEFGSGGGLNKISFQGDALFLEAPGTAPAQAKMYAGLYLEFDFTESSLWGQFEIYLNVNGIKGVGPNNRAGLGQIYFGPGDWYIYLGEPNDPIGVQMAEIAQATAYFVTGTYVPGIPPPPANVSEILGDIDLDMCRDLNQLDNAGGFAFGASLNLSTGKREFMIFYGSFDAGVGFDLMLVNYGDNVHCAGSDDVLGINGWYASGQMYAFIQGEIGMHFELFGNNKDITILDIGAAVVLQAQLPNPLYMKGAVGGHYNVLGGLVKGNCHFEVEIGEQCEVVNENVLEGLEVIAEIVPSNGSGDVDVFSSPQAAFNFELDKEFELVDDQDIARSFRIKFDYMKVTQNGNQIDGEYVWNTDKTILAFESSEILPPSEQLTMEVKVTFEEKVDGTWQTVEMDGEVASEVQSSTFQTGEAPDYIPLSNIEFSYPIMNQLNFYRDEYSSGHIQLDRGQSYLFAFEPGEQWRQEVRFQSLSHAIAVDFTYNNSEKQLSFSIPSNLSLNTIYKLTMVNIPLDDNPNIDENVDINENYLESGDTVSTRYIEGEARKALNEDEVLAYPLRTSTFSDFESKINAMSVYSEVSYPIDVAISRIYKNFNLSELFSKQEVLGDEYSEALIEMEFITTSNNWYNNYMYPLLWDDYPNYGVTLSRSEGQIGIPPTRAIKILQDEYLELTEDMVTTGQISWNSSYNNINFQVTENMYSDYQTLGSMAASLDYTNNQRLYDLIFTGFTSLILYKHYYFDIKYKLPGLDIITTSKRLSFYHD